MDSRASDDGHVLPYRIVPPAGWEWLTPIYDALCSVFGYGRFFHRWLSIGAFRPQSVGRWRSNHAFIG